MKVHDIEQYFSDLARLIQATDAKKSAAGLTRIAEGLRPFREYELEAFAGFLKRAEEYHRTGIVPAAGKPAKPGPAPKSKEKSDISALLNEIKGLYYGAGSNGTTMEAIEGVGQKLQPLKKDEIVEIAQAIGLVGMEKKTKADLVEQVVSRIRSIKQSAVRTAII